MKVVPRCSNCDRPLMGIVITRPEVDVRWRVRAECPYGCLKADGSPETSFIEEFSGAYAVGGYSDDADDAVIKTAVVGQRDDVDAAGKPVLTFRTKKARNS